MDVTGPEAKPYSEQSKPGGSPAERTGGERSRGAGLAKSVGVVGKSVTAVDLGLQSCREACRKRMWYLGRVPATFVVCDRLVLVVLH